MQGIFFSNIIGFSCVNVTNFSLSSETMRGSHKKESHSAINECHVNTIMSSEQPSLYRFLSNCSIDRLERIMSIQLPQG